MDKKELQKAQNIVDELFYDDKALTGWQHNLLEDVISIAQTKLRQPDVVGRSERLKAFMHFAEFAKQEYGMHIPLNLMKEYVKSL